jgi:hypothetical protein
MNDAQRKPYLTLDLRCGCDASLFVECPQEASYSLANDLTKLAATWSQSHAAHHRSLDAVAPSAS